MKFDKSKMKDNNGRMITQSLFLEHNYSEFAMFSFDDDDKEFKGKVYPSIKKLYLECADPTEYIFAKKYLLGWEHWKRILENKALLKEIEMWREELEVMLRSEALRSITAMEQNFQAQKFLSEKGWEKMGVGRPKKVDPLKEEKIQDAIALELKDTLKRMDTFN